VLRRYHATNDEFVKETAIAMTKETVYKIKFALLLRIATLRSALDRLSEIVSKSTAQPKNLYDRVNRIITNKIIRTIWKNSNKKV
jgi:hypothetical protein